MKRGREGRENESADAVTGATIWASEGFAASASAPAPASAPADRVTETVDAVTGATWTTRNTIMARLFAEDLATRGDEMPAFRPAGT